MRIPYAYLQSCGRFRSWSIAVSSPPDRLGILRKYDGLMNYMYLPESPPFDLPESVALLYMTVILHHDIIEGQRITQLTYEGAQQLQRKLVLFASGLPVDRNEFTTADGLIGAASTCSLHTKP